MRVKKVEDEPLEIMLIPMIDCMLVIIIFFLVSTTMKSHEKELPVDLPAATAAIEAQPMPDLFIVGIDRAGVPYLSNGEAMEAVDSPRLNQRLAEVARENPNRRIRIDGDRATPFEDIVRVVDLCQFVGLKNVGIHVRNAGGYHP